MMRSLSAVGVVPPHLFLTVSIALCVYIRANVLDLTHPAMMDLPIVVTLGPMVFPILKRLGMVWAIMVYAVRWVPYPQALGARVDSWPNSETSSIFPLCLYGLQE